MFIFLRLLPRYLERFLPCTHVSQEELAVFFFDALTVTLLVTKMNGARFGKRYFVDELPSRTRKSVADAAAAGKGYITPTDIK